jgi:hypothetical protein
VRFLHGFLESYAMRLQLLAHPEKRVSATGAMLVVL